VVRLTFKYYVACDIKITPTLVLHIQIKEKTKNQTNTKPDIKNKSHQKR